MVNNNPYLNVYSPINRRINSDNLFCITGILFNYINMGSIYKKLIDNKEVIKEND